MNVQGKHFWATAWSLLRIDQDADEIAACGLRNEAWREAFERATFEEALSVARKVWHADQDKMGAPLKRFVAEQKRREHEATATLAPCGEIVASDMAKPMDRIARQGGW